MSTKKFNNTVPEVVVAVKPIDEKVVDRPPMYRVFLVNDDYTPMDFVVEVLMKFFTLSEPEATLIMLQVHKQGKGYCGVFTRDIAEAKVLLVNNYARSCQYPLLCQMEKT